MEKYLVQRIEDNEETTKRQELIDARRITQELEKSN